MTAFALALLACAARADPPPPAPTAAPAPTEAPAVIETIEETTVGDLGGTRVPMANLSQRAYQRADGTTAEGWTCTLVIPGAGPTVVGVGSVATVGATRWEVTAVSKPPGALGSVTLRMLP